MPIYKGIEAPPLPSKPLWQGISSDFVEGEVENSGFFYLQGRHLQSEAKHRVYIWNGKMV